MIRENGQQVENSQSTNSHDDLSFVERVARFAEKSFQGIFDSALQQQATHSMDGTTIGFTGSGNQSGTTTTTIHAGIHSAIGRDWKTLLIDANFKSPKIGQALGVESPVGLSDCLIDAKELDTSVKKTEISRLSVLPSGSQSLKSQKNLAQKFENLIQELESDFKVILIDFPNSFGRVIQLFGTACDQIILVSNPNTDSSKRTRAAKNRLAKKNIHVKGLFLNNFHR